MPATPTRLDVLAGLAAALGSLALAPAACARSAPTIAAASDLQFALPEVVEAFRAQGGGALKIVFGSSGAFTTQIEQGAPFELFLSADQAYVQRLAGKGLTQGEGVRYAQGRIALFAPHGSALQVDGEMRDLRAALADGRLRRFAIANPEHAPYGRAAREALIHAGLWDAVAPRLVLGENAAQAAQFASSGSAQGGLIPHALALAPELAARGTSALIPAAWHQPLNQQMTLLKGAGPTARAFYAYLQSPAAKAILARYGFSTPATAAA
jgi:molybdate transport system substrate-binding protein